MGGGGGGPHRHQGNRPRRFNNNRPQGGGSDDPANVSRTRRNATQNREKYQMMARDALSAGDRVLAEYYLQHADHYYRVLGALPPEEAPRPQFQQQPRYNNPQGEGQAQDVMHDGAAAAAESPADHLPSFITQPVDTPRSPEE